MSPSPTGLGAATAEHEEEEEDVEAQRLGKSSSLSFEVGGGRVLSPGRGAASVACGPENPHPHPAAHECTLEAQPRGLGRLLGCPLGSQDCLARLP